MNLFNLNERETYIGYITKQNLPSNGIFVFGSNTEGKHGKGNALTAKRHFGAIYGQPSGLQGKSYGLITTDLKLKRQGKKLDSNIIMNHIYDFYMFALSRPDLKFYVAYTAEGKLLSGYNVKTLAEMFFYSCYTIPNNVIFEDNFYKIILKTKDSYDKIDYGSI